MLVSGKPFRTIWMPDASTVRIIDQRRLPWSFDLLDLCTVAEVAHAIKDMAVRGAGLIGATAGYGMALAAREASDMAELEVLATSLVQTRPTAVNLSWAVQRQLAGIRAASFDQRVEVARTEAERIADEDAEACAAIGQRSFVTSPHGSRGRW